MTDQAPARVVLVTGLSGAGKSSALKCLEDMGYEAIDNLPLQLLGRLLHQGEDKSGSGALAGAVAIGVDFRTRDFAVGPLLEQLEPLTARPGLDLSILFLDCDDQHLRRRFTETRRRHPLADDRPVTDGIAHERTLMAGLREKADVAIDTSNLSVADLRLLIEGKYALDAGRDMTVTVTSFAYRQGLPREADLVFDVRFLANPHYVDNLRPLTGIDRAVGEHIAADPAFPPFRESLFGLIGQLLPHYKREGKSYLTVAVGCTGGRHRSVYVAERLADWLRERGEHVHVRHRELSALAAEQSTGSGTEGSI